QAVLERAGWLEADGLGGGDVDLFAGLGIAALAGGALLDIESTKIGDGIAAVDFQGAGNGGKDRGIDLGDLGLAYFGALLGYDIYQLCFCHSSIPRQVENFSACMGR